jgi:hypothetical protein
MTTTAFVSGTAANHATWEAHATEYSATARHDDSTNTVHG